MLWENTIKVKLQPEDLDTLYKAAVLCIHYDGRLRAMCSTWKWAYSEELRDKNYIVY